MKIWIHIDGKQEGPFDEHSLPLSRMNSQTPVWYEGLSYWTPAISAPVTSEIIRAYLAGQQLPNQPLAPSDSEGPIDVEQADDTAPSEGPQWHDSSEQPKPSYGIANSGFGSAGEYNQQPRSPQEPEKRPATYLVWSILLTVLCCNPIGIVAIVLGSGVNSKYYNYDFEGARRRSELTAWWLIITIVTSLIFAPFSILINL